MGESIIRDLESQGLQLNKEKQSYIGKDGCAAVWPFVNYPEIMQLLMKQTKSLYILQVFFSVTPNCWTATMIECIWNLMALGDAQEGKWRGNWWMEWVASTLTLPQNMVYPALLTLMRAPRLPAVDWTDAPANLNELVHFSERRNLISAHMPARFKRSLQALQVMCQLTIIVFCGFSFKTFVAVHAYIFKAVVSFLRWPRDFWGECNV